MLEVSEKDLRDGLSFDRAKAADGGGKFHCHPNISLLCTKTK